jgi:limonene-1,2-epoxide hydrolase
MSEANKQAALDFIHAMSDADVARQDELLAPGAFTNTMGFGQVSGRRDRATMLATAGAFEQLVPTGFRPTIEKVVAEGDFVAV